MSVSAYPGHSIRVGASIQEQINNQKMTLKSGDHERSVSILWNTEKVEGTMRYYHRPLAHTTFIIHFSLTLKWTLNCTNIWSVDRSGCRWMLTLSLLAFGSAPLSRSSWTTSRWPFIAETMSAVVTVDPSYERQDERHDERPGDTKTNWTMLKQ